MDISLPLPELTNLAKLVYTDELLFGFGITSIKISILWFYHNVFSVHQTLDRVIKAATAVCLLWLTVATLVIAFQCKPVQAYWEHFDLPPYCLEYPRVLLGYEISNLFIDVAILCIPIGAVSRLNLPWLKKVPVIGIFLLGAVVCIFSILRLTAIWNPPNIFQHLNFSRTYVWSTLQLGVAIITSCLPTFGALLQFIARPVPYIRSWYESLRSRPPAAQSGDRYEASDTTSADRWMRAGDDRLSVISQAWAYGEDHGSLQYALRPIPSRAILVNREVEVV